MYDISGMPRGEEDAGPGDDDIEMPDSPSDRLLMQSTSPFIHDVETEHTTSRAQALLLKAMRASNRPKNSCYKTAKTDLLPKSPSLTLVPSSTTLNEEIEGENATPDEDIESESSDLNSMKYDESGREVDGYTCQGVLSPESGSLLILSYMQWVTDEDPLNASSNVSDHVRTMEMKVDAVLGPSVVPSSSVIVTGQLTASTSDTTESSMRPCLPDTVSDKKEENNLQPGKVLAGSNDKHANGDAESLATSTEPRDQDDELLASQNGKAASAETISREHSRMTQQFHQPASSPDHEYTMELFLRDNSGILKHNVPDLCSPSQDGDISIEIAATETSPETSGYSDDAIKAAPEYYSVVRNGRKTHYIMRRNKSVPKWKNLTSLPEVVHRGVRYKVGDVVYILLQDDTKDSFAKIREIRDLANGRKVICALWYFSIKDARSYGCTTLRRWPKGKSHMLTNVLQVLTWDTINGMVDKNVLSQLVSGKILDVCRKGCKILESDAKVVTWINQPARG